MKQLISNPLLLIVLCFSASQVLAVDYSLADSLPREASTRVSETIQFARHLRDTQRQLLTCEESLPAIQEALGDGSLTSCECLEVPGTESSIVNCQDFCQLCRDEWSLCVAYDYAFNFIQGNLETFLGRLEYSGSRTDVLEFEETYSGNGQDIATCSTSVNGVDCNSCVPSTGGCIDGVVYDCTNIEAGALFDECAGDFENIAETSVFAAYNTDFFDDADCYFFPTVSPAPTITALPTSSAGKGIGSPSPTRPPLITLDLAPFSIEVEYTHLNPVEFSQTILDYLTYNLNLFFPSLGGIVLDQIQPDGSIPPHRVTFEFTGQAVFLGNAPNPLALEAAQRYLLQQSIALQQAITANPLVGKDVYIIRVLVHPDTLAPTQAPSPRPTKGFTGGKGKGGGWNPWEPMSMKSMGKGKSKGSKSMKKSMGGSKKKSSKKNYYHHEPSYHHHSHSVHDHMPAPVPSPVQYPTPPATMTWYAQHRPNQGNGPMQYSHWSMNGGGSTWNMNHMGDSGMGMSTSVWSGWSSSGGNRSPPTWQMNNNNGYGGFGWSKNNSNNNHHPYGSSWNMTNGGTWKKMGMYTQWKMGTMYHYGGYKKSMGGSKKKMKSGKW